MASVSVEKLANSTDVLLKNCIHLRWCCLFVCFIISICKCSVNRWGDHENECNKNELHFICKSCLILDSLNGILCHPYIKFTTYSLIRITLFCHTLAQCEKCKAFEDFRWKSALKWNVGVTVWASLFIPSFSIRIDWTFKVKKKF